MTTFVWCVCLHHTRTHNLIVLDLFIYYIQKISCESYHYNLYMYTYIYCIYGVFLIYDLSVFLM